jgi:ABC-type transport system substrate-binding protein
MWITMNLGERPFDDVHVRRAVQLVTDKARLLATLDRTAMVQTHAIPDAFENGLLADYDPYSTDGHHGSIDGAKAEMALSSYDTDHDGVCDDAACAAVNVPVGNDEVIKQAAADFAASLVPLGLKLTFEYPEDDDPFELAVDPANHIPLVFGANWYSDYLNASSWLVPLAASSGIGDGANLSLIGASDDQLREWGYSVTGLPSLDAKIYSCVALTGADQFGCWAEADQYLMERIAAWVPIGSHQWSRLTSDRVRTFQDDAALGAPSLSEIEVASP